MAIIISSVQTDWNIDETDIINAALESCALRWSDSLDSNVYNTEIHRNDRGHLARTSSVYVNLSNIDYEKTLSEKYDFITVVEDEIPVDLPHNRKKEKIYVAGFGPAGMFAAMLLAENGYNPIVIERGVDIDARTEQVNNFLSSGLLSEKNNMKYGEGGARVFHDNKLLSRPGDPFVTYIISRMIKFGAPKSILTEAQPKITSEIMKRIVKGIRYQIIDNGGEVNFGQQLTGVKIENGKLRSIMINGKREERCDRLILSFGQNASDMYRMLLPYGIPMSSRPYLAGVRIEQSREEADEAVYGHISDSEKKYLPPAVYNLRAKIDGRDVFTYRVMGGGVVLPANANNDTLSVEGALRGNALTGTTTAAVCVAVNPSDYSNGAGDPLAGLNFQRKIEESARSVSRSNKAPATVLGAFLEGKADLNNPTVPTTYPVGLVANNFTDIFPPFVLTALKSGFAAFGQKLKCFGNGKSLLTAPETRIISPVKIERNEDFSVKDIEGIYVCGECAGYTEGVLGSAVEGLKVARGVAESH
jgi:uncharacterized FAD-dependent dehydrogenase